VTPRRRIGSAGPRRAGAALRPCDNPFAAGRFDTLAYRPDRRPGTPVDTLLARLDALGGRAALVGPEGHGKTTLLDALEPRLGARGLVVRRLTVGRDRPPARGELARFLHGAAPGVVLVVDGAGHLGARDRWRLRRAARRAAGLLVTAHHPLRPPLRLPTLVECTTTPELLQALVDELLAGEPAPLPLPPAAALHARHAGNLRDALRELYDRCAGIAVG